MSVILPFDLHSGTTNIAISVRNFSGDNWLNKLLRLLANPNMLYANSSKRGNVYDGC